MWYSLFAFAAAEGTAPSPGPSPSPLFSYLPLVALVAIMYFLMIRPNQRREKERRDMLASLAKGDKVITSGGLLGTVVGLSDKSVVLRVSEEPAVKMEFVRGAVSKVLPREESKK